MHSPKALLSVLISIAGAAYVLREAKSLEANSLICKMIGVTMEQRKYLERMDSAVQSYLASFRTRRRWCVRAQSFGEFGVNCGGSARRSSIWQRYRSLLGDRGSPA